MMELLRNGYRFYVDLSTIPPTFSQKKGIDDDGKQISELVTETDVNTAWGYCAHAYKTMKDKDIERLAGAMFRIFTTREDVKSLNYAANPSLLSILEYAANTDKTGSEVLSLIRKLSLSSPPRPVNPLKRPTKEEQCPNAKFRESIFEDFKEAGAVQFFIFDNPYRFLCTTRVQKDFVFESDDGKWVITADPKHAWVIEL
jgi:hypothetical protein